MAHQRAIIILADGARPDVLEELARRGDLPYISRYLLEGGTYRHAVTTFPSTTGPAYMPFLTGCLPATCNVPGIRWVDRSRFGRGFHVRNKHRSYVGIDTFRFNRDMATSIPTAFELIPKSYSIFNMISRGAGWRNLTKIMRIWYWYYAHLTDRWGFVDQAATEKMLHAVRRYSPQFLFVVYPGIDEYSHFSDPRHERVIQAYRDVDKGIGRLFAELRAKGGEENTMVWLVSDHGLSATHTHFCLNAFLESRGIKTFYYPLVMRRAGAKAANMMSGNGMSHLYFRQREGWGVPMVWEDFQREYPGLVEELAGEAAVDLVGMRDRAGTIRVLTKKGKGRITLHGDRLDYQEEGDLFGYAAAAGGGSVCITTAEESLQKTIDTEHPDLPYQLAHLFTSPRTGDLVLSATPGYDLRLKYEHPEHKSSHGSIHRDHMLVPVATNYKFSAPTLRTVDIFPTILRELGLPMPLVMDGVVLH